LPSFLQAAFALLATLVAVVGAGHALLNKRDPRAAFAWIAVCLLIPVGGVLLYFFFGINRVQTRARRLSRAYPFRLHRDAADELAGEPEASVANEELPARWRPLARVSEGVGSRPLVPGSAIAALHEGADAFPVMLRAIEDATTRVWLSTYIFETGPMGQAFIDALVDAHARGVEVRVLIDGVGELYSWPWAGRLLRRRGVRVERFMRPGLIPLSLHLNLRNHRKILVVDDREAFVGGMNIGDRHLPDDDAGSRRMVDLHFHVHGPVVSHIATMFAEDWQFVTRESLRPDMGASQRAGDGVIARAFSDGPNEDMGRLSTVLIAAVGIAQQSIDIMTPYFLPPAELMSALQSAGLRGVHVRVVLPGRNNLPYVDWASRHVLPELLRYGVEVCFQPPPFVHSKLLVVDRYYALIGSANLDSRSLRLNFELAVEVFDQGFAQRLGADCDRAAAASTPITLSELECRSFPRRVRDAVAWLFSPYL
jgi:cardiolipin synthase